MAYPHHTRIQQVAISMNPTEYINKRRELRDTQNEIERIQKSIATYQELIGEHERVLALLKAKLEAIE